MWFFNQCGDRPFSADNYLKQKFWLLVTVTLISTGVISDVVSYQADTW